MLYFIQTTINQIKAASDEQEVEDVINDSLQRLKVKNIHGHIIQRFILGLGLALSREIGDQQPTKTMENMSSAMGILRKLQKPLV